jgi:hypothetical protein
MATRLEAGAYVFDLGPRFKSQVQDCMHDLEERVTIKIRQLSGSVDCEWGGGGSRGGRGGAATTTTRGRH